MGLFTAKSPVAVTIKGDRFIGWAVGDFTGSGTIDIQSVVDPSTTCVGEFRYISTWTKTGKGTVSCNDGSQGQFNFKGLTNLKGFGYGTSNRGPLTFTYGMTAQEGSKYLQKPFPELDKTIQQKKTINQAGRYAFPKIDWKKRNLCENSKYKKLCSRILNKRLVGLNNNPVMNKYRWDKGKIIALINVTKGENMSLLADPDKSYVATYTGKHLVYKDAGGVRITAFAYTDRYMTHFICDNSNKCTDTRTLK
jgi:hypothetical protein